MSVQEMTDFFKKNPKHRDILERAIKIEEEKSGEPHWLGWAWRDVRAYPAQLVKMVIEGIIKVNFKSNSTTTYLIVDTKTAKKALVSV